MYRFKATWKGEGHGRRGGAGVDNGAGGGVVCGEVSSVVASGGKGGDGWSACQKATVATCGVAEGV